MVRYGNNNLTNIPNFYQVDPALYRGGQPAQEGFEELKSLGIKKNLSPYLGAINKNITKIIWICNFFAARTWNLHIFYGKI